MLSFTNATNSIYISQEWNYSFSIPDDWQEIPKDTIDVNVQAMAETNNTKFTNYKAGFQKKNKVTFEYPYVLVLEQQVKTPSYEDIMNAFGGAIKNIDQYADEYSETVNGTNIGRPAINKEKNIIVMNVEANVANIGKVKQLIVIFIWKNNLTYLYFSSTQSKYTKDLPSFYEIINSFKYNDGYEYDETYAKENYQVWFFENLLNNALEGMIWILPLALVWWLFVFFRKRKINKKIVK